MSSKVVYKMYGFNKVFGQGSSQHLISIDEDIIWKYSNHEFLESYTISKDIKSIEFVLLPGKEAKDYLNDISDELEKVCFNIITYTEIPTVQPICYLEQIFDADGQSVSLRDNLNMYDTMTIRDIVRSKEIVDKIMTIQTPIKEKKAEFKEIFFILQNPYKVIQYMALYDKLHDMICKDKKGQNTVTNFFGKNKERYQFVSFVPRSDNPKKNEDSFSHLRNNIAHSEQAGIEQFMRTAEGIRDKEISELLFVINDIIAGRVDVNE